MRGAWIEIMADLLDKPMVGRSPCGERGLKSVNRHATAGTKSSLPMRGAWIEISTASEYLGDDRSLPMRGAWIEI